MKQKQRERMQPKMGKMDIDYQVSIIYNFHPVFVFVFKCCNWEDVHLQWSYVVLLMRLWFLFVRFSMMRFSSTRLSQSWQLLVICTMKGRSLRYYSCISIHNLMFFVKWIFSLVAYLWQHICFLLSIRAFVLNCSVVLLGAVLMPS